MALLYFIFILLVGLVSCNTNCSAIKGVIGPTIKDLVINSPLFYYWNIGSVFNCSIVSVSYPRSGSKDYFGSAILTNSLNNQATVFKVDQNPDKITYYLTNCTAGCVTPTKVLFTAVAHKSSKSGSFSCFSVCEGEALIEFICVTSTKQYLNEMAAAVNSLKGIPNADKIHQSQINCPSCEQCSFLNF